MQAIKGEMKKRNIKAKFLGIHEYFKDYSTKEIDERRLVDDIKEINPSMVVMVICYSQILCLRFLLEGAGIFSEVRMNRDLCLQSKGQILTMSETQKKFLQTMAHPENIKKRLVRIEGQVGSGKTMLGIEVLKMKLAHYIRFYGLTASEGRNHIRTMVIFGKDGWSETVKSQLEEELKKDIGNQSSFEIHNIDIYNIWVLKGIIYHYENYDQFKHTIVLIDECQAMNMKYYTSSELEDKIFIDYIHCIHYGDIGKLGNVIKERVKNETRQVSCQLLQFQRSSQQILELANYLNRHMGQTCFTFPTKKSFSVSVPLWIHVETQEAFVEYAKSNYSQLQDVMLIYESYESKRGSTRISKLCADLNWRYCNWDDITGSESSVVIIFDHKDFHYESFTRAKHKLIVVTIPDER